MSLRLVNSSQGEADSVDVKANVNPVEVPRSKKNGRKLGAVVRGRRKLYSTVFRGAPYECLVEVTNGILQGKDTHAIAAGHRVSVAEIVDAIRDAGKGDLLIRIVRQTEAPPVGVEVRRNVEETGSLSSPENNRKRREQARQDAQLAAALYEEPNNYNALTDDWLIRLANDEEGLLKKIQLAAAGKLAGTEISRECLEWTTVDFQNALEMIQSIFS